MRNEVSAWLTEGERSIPASRKGFLSEELRGKSFCGVRSPLGQLSSLIGETRSSRVRNTTQTGPGQIVNPSSEPSQGKSPVLKEKAISAPAAASAGTPVAHSPSAAAPAKTSGEKRRADRTRTDQLLYVELGTGNGGILLDVSEEGCGFLSIAPIWDDAPHFSFAIGGGRQIQGNGKVVWLDQTKKVGGLRFVDTSPAFRERVRAWLAEPKVEAPAPEPKPIAEPQTDILKPIEDSPARQRRRQLREEARARMLEAECAMRAAESGEVSPDDANKHGANAVEDVQGSRGQIFLHGPSQRAWPAFLKNGKVWKGVAGFVFGGALAALAFAYHQQAGTALMRLGTSLAGKREQVAAAENSAAAVTSAPAELKSAPAEAKPLVKDAVEHKVEPMNSAPTGQPAKIQAVASGSKTPPQNAPTTSTANVGSNPSALVQKLNAAAAESTVKKQGLDTLTHSAGGAQYTNAMAVKPAQLAQTSPPKKKEPHHATAEQVQALWSEVEGGDISAAVALGELYARGNGVPKSCGQARMLLNSAAKKGSDAAQQKLDQLADEGCP